MIGAGNSTAERHSNCGLIGRGVTAGIAGFLLLYSSVNGIKNVDTLTNVDRLQYARATPVPSATPTELPCLDKCGHTKDCKTWCTETHQ